jgi:mono/diheme cytochrome c family protein
MKRYLWGVVTGLALPPLGFAVVASLGLVPTNATSDPPAVEATVATAALKRSIARQSSALKSPLPPTEENLAAGLKLYKNMCDGCHGGPAAPSDWGSKDFYPRAPQFGSHKPPYAESEIFYIVKNGIRYTGMGAVSSDVTDQDVWKLSLFLARLDALPQAVDAKWREK